ncbi:TELO2-interacting protein 1 [Tanacetum coccineum]
MGTIDSMKSILTQSALDVLCEKFHIPDTVHPELPGRNDRIRNSPTIKSLSVIAVAKVFHFEILCRVYGFVPTVGSKKETFFNSQARLESEVCTQLANMIPLQVDNNRYSRSSFPINEIDIDKCLLAFLQSQSATVSVGHWLSPLIKSPDVEVGRGKGSSKIRVEAFITLRVLVAKVGTADQLAFFLPGVELRALIEFLMIVLQDEANISSLDDSDIDLYMNKSTLLFLEELRHLKMQDHGQFVKKKSIPKSSQSDVKVLAHGTYKRLDYDNFFSCRQASVNNFSTFTFWQSFDNSTSLGFAVLNSLDVPASECSYWISAAAILGFALLFNILSLWLSSPEKPQAIISKEEVTAAQGHGDGSNKMQHIKPNADANGAAKKGMVLPFTSLAMFGTEEHRRC